ncbi:hypothetical protein WBJ53_19575 [Spirosoma sp. SC4-14]|uniref:hypothetical protein n=1 Tax=Spirosoma sp. SC4-14 TaxID=3128900 RepID=UPI0030CA974F
MQVQIRCVGLLICGILLVGRTTAQSLLVGIPSADVAKKGHLEYTHESQWGRGKDGYFKWNSFNFFTYGFSERTELALSLVNVGWPETRNVALGAGYKTIIPLGNKPGLFSERKLAIGQMVYVATGKTPSVARDRLGGWVYTHLSTRLAPSRTRLTAGLSYGSSHVFGFRYGSIAGMDGIAESSPPLVANTPFCFIGGLEQPLSRHISLIVDWFSGRHDLAAVIPAVQLNLGKQVLILGYKRANDQHHDTNALVTELMIHF